MASTLLLGRSLLSRGHSGVIQHYNAPLRQNVSTWRVGIWRGRVREAPKQLRRRPASTQSKTVTWEEGVVTKQPSSWNGERQTFR